MKKLLIVTGDLATGKSTFSNILSERYECCSLCKDRIKELLADSVGFSSREENLHLSIAAVEMMIHSFSQMARCGHNLILEANFKENELKKIREIADDFGYSTLTLVFRANIDIIYRRFVNRIDNENRHPAHLSGFDGYDTFKYYIDNGRQQATFGEVIHINADDFSYQSDERILSKIDDFFE